MIVFAPQCNIGFMCIKQGGKLDLELKGKLAHNFTISWLMLIPCLLYIVKIFIKETDAKIVICCVYRGTKIQIWEPLDFGFPN